MIIVGGISENDATKLNMGKAVTVQPFATIKPKILSFLSEVPDLSKVRDMFMNAEPEPICISWKVIWPGEHKDHYEEMMEPMDIDMKSLDIMFKLLSTKTNDSMVVFGTYFSIDDMDDDPYRHKAGYVTTGYRHHPWADSLEADPYMIASAGWFYNQARKHLADNTNGKKAKFLKTFHDSLFASQEQRFLKMTECLDMLVSGEDVDVESNDFSQVKRKELNRIFEVRDAYVRDGIRDGIAELFPQMYALLIRVTRLLLDDSFDMDDCRTWGFSQTI